jgi:hypothetical protein
MAFNCLYRGSGTLIINLLENIRFYPTYIDVWQAQYADGAINRISETELNPIFVGLSFTMLSYYLYKEFQVILIGIIHGIKHSIHGITQQGSSNVHVVLNPGKEYIIDPLDRCLFINSSEIDIQAIKALVYYCNNFSHRANSKNPWLILT